VNESSSAATVSVAHSLTNNRVYETSFTPVFSPNGERLGKGRVVNLPNFLQGTIPEMVCN